ncbi:choice-of-anchor D domain-containing protein [Hyalangium versicolor]|uniref:choice-of-anchor D domain-containing protein n=1 Tax=Hyalangium versicolor TaxID=2861190 RepID=UPI001CCC58D0|nr:choice-of-anchor D domain-containing protein [Hyalangium versicolor]
MRRLNVMVVLGCIGLLLSSGRSESREVGDSSQLQWSTSSIDFGASRVFQPSDVRLVKITNTGSAQLAIFQFTFSQGAFTLVAPPPPSPAEPLRLAPGDQVFLSLQFTPTAVGTALGNLSVISNASEEPVPLGLKGAGLDGRMIATPSTVSFGEVEVGGMGKQQTVLVENVGTYPLEIGQVVSPADAAFTLSGLPSRLKLQPGGSWPVTVTFAPVRRGSVASTLLLATDSLTSPLLTLSLSGTGVAAEVALLDPVLEFGSASVGGSVTQDLAIKNVGDTDLVVFDLSFEDEKGGPVGVALDFSRDAVFPVVLLRKESLRIPVKFSPQAEGSRTAQALVATNAGVVEGVLHGVGTSPRVEVSTSQLAFGNVQVSSFSTPQVITLTNTGTAPLLVRALAMGGEDAAAFTLTAPSLPVTLPPGSAMDVALAFRPEAERPFSALLRVDSNALSTPNVLVPLTGAGVARLLYLSESALDFGKQPRGTSSSPRKVRIINGGSGPAALSVLNLGGPGASQFSLVAPPLPLVLAEGQEQEIEVVFSPQAQTEEVALLNAVFLNPAQILVVMELRGQGIEAALSLHPSALDFGQFEVGDPTASKEITVMNASSQEQRVSARLKDEVVSFSLDSSALDLPIPAGGSAIVRVSFSSQEEAESLNEVQVYLQGIPEPVGTLPVKGIGTKRSVYGCSSGGSSAGGAGTLALLVLAIVLGSQRSRPARG